MNTATQGRKIPVKIYEAGPPAADSDAAPVMGGFGDVVARVFGRYDNISTDALRGSLDNLLSNFSHALGGIPEALAGYHVEEIELSLDVRASGEVSLIIGGAEVEGSAGLKVTLKRLRNPGGKSQEDEVQENPGGESQAPVP